MLKIDDLQVHYGLSHVIQGISLEAKPGEVVGIFGRNGVGKTTLMKAIAGGWDHGKGRIRAPAARTLFLPQKAYFPQGDIFGAIAYPGFAEDCDRQDIRAALEAVGLSDADIARLGGAADGHPLVVSDLSGGELQRLALARALVHRPDWLFLDEATSALDDEAEAGLLAMLRQKLPRAAIVIVSHRDPAAIGARRTIDLEARPRPAAAAPELQHA